MRSTMLDTASSIMVEISPGVTRAVPWGKFTIPGIEGTVRTGTGHDDDGRVAFAIRADTIHAHEEELRELFVEARRIAAAESIYRGKAISIRFKDDDGDARDIPAISFVTPSQQIPIFSRATERTIDANVLTPIRHANIARAAGIPLKRGTLLAGPYGTGKTLLAGMIAVEANANGWTFLYVPECTDLADALAFAQRYQPAVVFCEDVERIAGLERTDTVNELLNTLDGIGSKKDEIMLVLSSNHAEQINPAMRRPGRIDLVLHITPPDADACVRLLQHYGAGTLMPDTDLGRAGEMLAGFNPATVREAMERAKLEAIRRSGGKDPRIIGEDVESVAETLRSERELFAPAIAEDPSHKVVGAGLRALGDAMLNHKPSR
jgi:transitional endoplasmic reticulum ATPase